MSDTAKNIDWAHFHLAKATPNIHPWMSPDYKRAKAAGSGAPPKTPETPPLPAMLKLGFFLGLRKDRVLANDCTT